MPVAANGDEYQERVWSLVRQIPYGETATYGDLARRLGDGTTPQEVGAAVGQEPGVPSGPLPSRGRCGREADRLRRRPDPQAVPPRPGGRGLGTGKPAVLTWALTFRPARRLPGVTDKQPFDEVVARHGPTVLRVCRALVGPVDADDAWSETFLSALRAYPTLPADANVEAWLVTIAHRKAIDLVRKAQRSATPVAEVPASRPSSTSTVARSTSLDCWAGSRSGSASPSSTTTSPACRMRRWPR